MKSRSTYAHLYIYIVFICGIISVIVILLSYFDNEKKEAYLKLNGLESIGTIDPRISIVLCKYMVQDKEYIGEFGNPFPPFLREKYKVLYDPKNPENFWVSFEYPIIEPDSLFNTTFTNSINNPKLGYIIW